MPDEPVAPAEQTPSPEPVPTPAASPAPSPAPNDTTPSPLSPHRGGKDWKDMEALFDKRDGKKVAPKKDEPPVKTTEKSKPIAPKSTTTPTPTPTQPSDPAAELLAIEPPEGFDEKGKLGWKEFKEKWHGLYKQAQEKVASVEKLLAEREGMTKKERAELEEQLNKARRYEYAFDFQADPEFKKKYIEPANKVYKELTDTLTRAGFDGSGIDWDDEISVESAAMAIQEKHGAAVANVFRNKANDLRGIRAGFREARDNAITNYDSIIAEKQKSAELKTVERDGIIKSTLDTVYSEKLEDGSPKWGFLNKKEIPPNADKVTTEAINEHNKLVDESRKRIDAMSRVDDPKDRAQLAVAAELGVIFSHERPILIQKIEELENELKQIQGGRTPPSSVPKTPAQPEVRYRRGASVADSFAEKFQK